MIEVKVRKERARFAFCRLHSLKQQVIDDVTTATEQVCKQKLALQKKSYKKKPTFAKVVEILLLTSLNPASIDSIAPTPPH